MRLNLLYASIFLFIGLVFLFSWLPNPHIGEYGFLPARLAYWTDANKNMNLRTAIPLVFLGVFSGIWLVLKRHKWSWWIGVWTVLVLVVAIAEVGQLVLPRRHFDWGDIVWGALGAGVGMVIVWVGHWVVPGRFFRE